jgi:thiosulfate/3-mercaptopyruvate sulfurtransferase
MITFAVTRGHIPSARYFDQLQHTKPTAFLPRGLPDVPAFEEYLASLGISNDDHIILYDRSAPGLFAAARAWFLLRVCTQKRGDIR